MSQAPQKVAIVTRMLAHGGAERFAALLSQVLDQLGYEVHLITVLNEIEYNYAGTLFNLGLMKEQDDSIFGRIKRAYQLKKYIQEQKFDWIIDNRNRCENISEWLISKYFYRKVRTIYMVHSYDLEFYFPRSKSLAQKIYQNAEAILCVSDEIAQKVKREFGYQNVAVQYNPVDVARLHQLAQATSISGKFILAYGRIDDAVKNFSLLILSYAQSILPVRGISLYILGDGPDVAQLKALVAQLKMENHIQFLPKTDNPFGYVQSAMFTTLTSKYEGFPMVLIESLALGTPVVSVDCHSGPREIISHEINGLLVENNNSAQFTHALNQMIEQPDLYQSMKEKAKNSVAHLSISNIAKDWKNRLG
jgi:glycosyltransferase involved in cell wall biosynthesis